MNEDDEYVTASERHHQIMQEGENFFRRLAWGCMGIILLIAGIVVYLLKYNPFWKYP